MMGVNMAAWAAVLLAAVLCGVHGDITVEPLRCYHCSENENCNENLGTAAPCRSVYDRCATFYDSATAVGVQARGCVKDTLSGCYTRDDGGKYCVCHTPFCNNYRIGILKIRAHKTDLLVGPSTAISFDVVEKPEGWQPEAEEDVVDDNSGVAFEGSNKQELEKDHAGEVGEQGPLADHEIVKMSASQAAETANDYGSVPLPAWGSKASDSSGLYEGTTLFEMKKDLLDKYRGNVPHGTRVIPIPPEAMKGESFPPNEKIVNLRSRPVYATVDEVMQRSREIIASGSDGRSVPSFSVFLSLVAVCRLF